jgi:alpha-1,2-mannosyltransferase
LHYLTHGYGLQTWEYSPEYSIRSWLYIVLHAVPTKLFGLVGSLTGRPKTFDFYALRVLLGFCCAAAETRLFSAISRTLNPRIGVFYLMTVVFSPGIFYASVAFLPSSFAMLTSTLGLAAFMDWSGGLKTAAGIMWFGIGALVGWPFAGVLIAPFVLEDWAGAIINKDTWEAFRRYLDGTVRCLVILALQIGVDTFFYHEVVIVPWRIVSYNVFGGKDRGPEIFGTELWHYYFRNLLLNFNIWFLLAIGVGPLLTFQSLSRRKQATKQTWLRTAVFVTPFYLWLTIFTLQPHKEERFMYPAYPFLALNAAIAFHIVLSWIGNTTPKSFMSKVPATVKLAVVLLFVAISTNIGLLRIVGTVSAYQAPLLIYEPLQDKSLANSSSYVCFGKDWYRFPSSHFLPRDMHAKFIKSEFDGLLPGQFSEAATGFGFFPGTWLLPAGMNDRNEEDPGKYIDVEHCTYLVDTRFPSARPSVLEPDYLDSQQWEVVKCADFLDASQTSLLGRMIWLPELDIIPERHRRHWGQHCLLSRRDASTTKS